MSTTPGVSFMTRAQIQPFIDEKYIGVQQHPTDTRFKRQYQVNDDFFDAIGEEQAWLLGLLASDSCVKDDHSFSLSQSHEVGRRLLLTIQRMLGHNGRLYHSGNAYSFMITSERIVTRLAEFGITPRKTLTFTFPEKIPYRHHAAFVRGYIDGDGSTGIYRTGNVYMPVISFVGTPEFIAHCIEVIPAKCRTRRIERCANLSEARFNGRNALKISEWLWKNDDLPLTYKQANIRRFFNSCPPAYIANQAKKQESLGLLARLCAFVAGQAA